MIKSWKYLVLIIHNTNEIFNEKKLSHSNSSGDIKKSFFDNQVFMVSQNILVEKMSYEVDYLGIVSHGYFFKLYGKYLKI